MMRALVLALVLAIGGTGFIAEAAPAKKKCPRGYKLVNRKCKKLKKQAAPKAVQTVSGGAGGSTVTIIPNATAKTATVKIKISCTNSDGIGVSQTNGAGTTVNASAVINLQQSFNGSVSDAATGASVSWQLTGLWKTTTRFEGIFSGTASPPGKDGFPGPGCSLSPTNVVLG